MSGPGARGSAGAVSRLIARTIEEELARQGGAAVRVKGVAGLPDELTSSFSVHRLRVTLDRGRPLDVIFKDLEPGHQSDDAKELRRPDREPGLRELRVYRDILPEVDLGTLRLYGYRWEPEDGRCWILLEYGGRELLRNTADLQRWITAARWIARFHGRSRALDPGRTGFLPRYDLAHYRRCAQRVEEILPGLSTDERPLVARGLERFRSLIPALAEVPVSVIHGQYFGQNILLRGRGGTLRAVPIDWETAALGPAAFDLVSLTSGKWTPEQRLAMKHAYLEEYRDLLPGELSWTRLEKEVRMVTLYQSLEWIAWWARHRRLSRDFTRFLRELSSVVAA